MSPELNALVEKVARALRQRRYSGAPLKELDAAGRLYWRLQATAAIRVVAEATREPSEAMLRAGHHEQDQCAIHNYGGSPTVEDVWRVMHAACFGEALRDAE